MSKIKYNRKNGFGKEYLKTMIRYCPLILFLLLFSITPISAEEVTDKIWLQATDDVERLAKVVT